MMLYIYYRTIDGEIMGCATGFEPEVVPAGMALAEVDATPDPERHKYDAAKFKLVDKSAEERRLARRPTLRDVQVAVYTELCRTDGFMVADRPIDDAEYHAWKTYRQMLRDLSKRGDDAADMIDAWSLPPDGVDPILALRERLEP